MLHKEKECLRRGIAFVLVGTTDAAEKLVSTTWLSLLKAHIFVGRSTTTLRIMLMIMLLSLTQRTKLVVKEFNNGTCRFKTRK